MKYWWEMLCFVNVRDRGVHGLPLDGCDGCLRCGLPREESMPDILTKQDMLTGMLTLIFHSNVYPNHKQHSLLPH